MNRNLHNQGEDLPPHLYSYSELQQLGFAACGRNVRIDRSVRFFGPEHVAIGDHVRIDCFSMISASVHGVCIGSNVHIGAGSYLFGAGGAILMSDFTGLSSRVALYTSTDDFVDGFLTNPTIPDRFRNVRSGSIKMDRHALIGSGSVVMPGVSLGFGASVGALTLVRAAVGDCEIVTGNPAKRLPTRRSRERLEALEAEYLASFSAKLY